MVYGVLSTILLPSMQLRRPAGFAGGNRPNVIQAGGGAGPTSINPSTMAAAMGLGMPGGMFGGMGGGGMSSLTSGFPGILGPQSFGGSLPSLGNLPQIGAASPKQVASDAPTPPTTTMKQKATGGGTTTTTTPVATPPPPTTVTAPTTIPGTTIKVPTQSQIDTSSSSSSSLPSPVTDPTGFQKALQQQISAGGITIPTIPSMQAPPATTTMPTTRTWTDPWQTGTIPTSSSIRDWISGVTRQGAWPPGTTTSTPTATPHHHHQYQQQTRTRYAIARPVNAHEHHHYPSHEDAELEQHGMLRRPPHSHYHDPFADRQADLLVELPWVHGYGFRPHENVYVRIRLVVYGYDEIEEHPQVLQDHQTVQCDASGSFVAMFEVDLSDESSSAAGLVEAHGTSSKKFARQRVEI